MARILEHMHLVHLVHGQIELIILFFFVLRRFKYDKVAWSHDFVIITFYLQT